MKFDTETLERRTVDQVSARVIDLLRWIVPHVRTRILLRVVEEFENENAMAGKATRARPSSQKAS